MTERPDIAPQKSLTRHYSACLMAYYKDILSLMLQGFTALSLQPEPKIPSEVFIVRVPFLKKTHPHWWKHIGTFHLIVPKTRWSQDWCLSRVRRVFYFFSSQHQSDERQNHRSICLFFLPLSCSAHTHFEGGEFLLLLNIDIVRWIKESCDSDYRAQQVPRDNALLSSSHWNIQNCYTFFLILCILRM